MVKRSSVVIADNVKSFWPKAKVLVLEPGLSNAIWPREHTASASFSILSRSLCDIDSSSWANALRLLAMMYASQLASAEMPIPTSNDAASTPYAGDNIDDG